MRMLWPHRLGGAADPVVFILSTQERPCSIRKKDAGTPTTHPLRELFDAASADDAPTSPPRMILAAFDAIGLSRGVNLLGDANDCRLIYQFAGLALGSGVAVSVMIRSLPLRPALAGARGSAPA